MWRLLVAQASQLAEKLIYFVIPRRAARRGISLFLCLNRREIPHFVRNDKINYFFRSLFSLRGLVRARTNPHWLKPALLKHSLCGGLQKEKAMVSGAHLDVAVEKIEKTRSLCGQEGEQSERSFLYRVIGKQ
jgi:hypothetical protein